MDHKSKIKTSSITQNKTHANNFAHPIDLTSVGTLGLVDVVPKFSFLRTRRSKFPILVFAKWVSWLILSGASENSRLMHYSSSTFHHAPPFWIWGTPPSFCIPPQSPFISLHIWDHCPQGKERLWLLRIPRLWCFHMLCFLVGRHCTDLPVEMHRLYSTGYMVVYQIWIPMVTHQTSLTQRF